MKCNEERGKEGDTMQIKIQSLFIPLIFGAVALAQEPAATPSSSGGWRRATEADAAQAKPAPQPPPVTAAVRGPLDSFGQPRGTAAPDPAPQSEARGTYVLPPELTLRGGTFVTLRIDQELSSNQNVEGDVFSGTLTKPIVIDGFVVARRGQTVAGRVVEAVKSGRSKGTARLGIELTELSLVDGQQVRFRSQFVNVVAPGSKGRDAAAVAATTGIGALAGAAADNGTGAAIGAGAGAAVGLIGVLLTRGHASIIEPESVLTFRVEQPITISTARSAHAFRAVDPQDHEREPARPALARRHVAAVPAYWGGPFYYPYPFWGPGIGVYYGRGWGRGRGRGWGGPGWWW